MGVHYAYFAVSDETLDYIASGSDSANKFWSDPSYLSSDAIDISKDWGVLEYLFEKASKGTPYEDISHISLMGSLTIDNNISTEIAYLVTKEQVCQVNKFLSYLTIEDLLAETDQSHMDEIQVYPGDWIDEEDDEVQEIVEEAFKEICSLYRIANDAGHAVIVLQYQ